METRQWELFAMQCHCIDFANHAFVPRHGWSSEEKQANLAYLARCYESVDRMVGDLLAGAGDETLICVVSDHGATESPNPEVFINAILEEAGLLMHKQQQPGAVRPEIDRSLTIAEQQRAAFIYINLQGRDPGGIVPPEQYEAVRDRIIATLRDYREPTTGRNPFSMILRKGDARILGLYDSLGRDIGDIVYALLPEFDHEHGRQLPGATLGGQTMKPLLTFHGPGIKGGAVLGRTAWLVDVVPTLAYALGWPLPSETEGAVLYQAFTEHSTNFPRSDFMQQQEKRLRAVQKRLVDRAGAARPVTDVTTEAETETEESSVEDEPLSETVSELQTALRQARAEARKWKSAYEQYHRITHGN
jgi:arylsulfatase A-like enzyme